LSSDELRHGDPKAHRNNARGFDKFVWPDGLELQVYDDGSVKIGRKHTTVTISDVMNRQRGGSARGSAHVVMRSQSVDEL
jgi:hypothetical protein